MPERLHVTLGCGHQTDTNPPIKVGDWLSCWALMYPERGCQTQRKVIKVDRFQERRQQA